MCLESRSIGSPTPTEVEKTLRDEHEHATINRSQRQAEVDIHMEEYSTLITS